jgi:hypothetical protein
MVSDKVVATIGFGQEVKEWLVVGTAWPQAHHRGAGNGCPDVGPK